MSTTQKIIKYLAIGFAFYLIFNIISAIVFGIESITNIFEQEETSIEEKYDDLNIDINDDVKILDIDISASKLIIKTGDKFKAETNNDNISIEQEDNKLFIKEKEHYWFNQNNKEIIIYIPSDFIFDVIYINTGAGNIVVEELNAKTIHLNLGTGTTKIDKLIAINNIEIEAGVGDIKILDGNLKNLDLDTGIGNIDLTAKIEGNSKIDSDIGDINLNLLGTSDDYKIEINKGIGNTTINNKKVTEDKTYGTGENIIEIDGDIGNIEIKIN